MKKNMFKKIFIFSVFLLPMVLFATSREPLSGGLGDTGANILGLLDVAKNVIFALAFIGFFWGLLQWIFASGDKKSEGKTIMIWGIVALVIMFSIWGIIGLVRDSFTGFDDGGSDLPGIGVSADCQLCLDAAASAGTPSSECGSVCFLQ